jgi:hypothetical protein
MSSPPQLGQRPFIASVQAEQNVQPYEQEWAPESPRIGWLQRSQELFISKPVYAPNRNDTLRGDVI